MRSKLWVVVLVLLWSCASAANVSLQWDASASEGVDGYNVYRSDIQGSGYNKINSALITGLTYTDEAAVEGATYYYVATSVRGGVESAHSNELKVDLPFTAAPLPPTGLRNTSQGANNTLQWNPVQHAERYAVDYADDPSSWVLAAVVTGTEFSFKAHPNGSPLFLGVRAMVGGLWGDRAVISR